MREVACGTQAAEYILHGYGERNEGVAGIRAEDTLALSGISQLHNVRDPLALGRAVTELNGEIADKADR